MKPCCSLSSFLLACSLCLPPLAQAQIDTQSSAGGTSRQPRVAAASPGATSVPPARSLLQDPPSIQQRAHDWIQDSFSVRTLLGAAAGAAITMASPPRRYPREWSDGGEAFGRNFGNYAAQGITGYTARFVASALLHENTHYLTCTCRGFAPRVAHSLAFTLIDRSDSGKRRLAVANLAGSLAAGEITTLYMPSGFNDQAHASQRSLFRLGGFALNNVYYEFKPELTRAARRLHLLGSGR